MKDRTKNLMKNLAILSVTTLICLVFTELALQIVSPPPKIFTAGTTDTYKARLYGWAFSPNEPTIFVHPDTGEITHNTMNSQGWKDVEHNLEKPGGILRVLFLGDSLTWGNVPLENLYTREVELRLKDRGFENVEVISIGVPGWGTDQALEVLQLEGVKYSPDIVVYQFYENDISDILTPDEQTKPNSPGWQKPFKYELVDGELKKLILSPQKSAVNAFKKFYLNHLYLKSAIAYNIGKAYLRFRYSGSDKWKDSRISPFGIYRAGEESETIRKGWMLFEALVLKMKQVIDGNNAEFAIFDGGGEGLKSWYRKWGNFVTDESGDFVMHNGKKYPIKFSRPIDHLREISERNSISLIEPIREYPSYDHDYHPNTEGNKRMALDIVDFLTEWDVFVSRYSNITKGVM